MHTQKNKHTRVLKKIFLNYFSFCMNISKNKFSRNSKEKNTELKTNQNFPQNPKPS